MRVRITFRSEIYIDADNIEKAVREWENMPQLFTKEALQHGAEFLEVVSAEDDETGVYLKSYFD